MTKLQLAFAIITSLFIFCCTASDQRGYYDAPYKRYEADLGVLFNATIKSKSYK